MEYRPGSKEDFDRLYQATYQRVFRTLVAILGDAAAAEDCAQDAFLKAYRAWPRWRGDSPAEAWIQRISINTALSFMRMRRVREIGELVRRLGRPVDPDPQKQVVDGQVLAEIRRLPAKQAAAVILRHLHGYSNREIAAALGEPESTIATRLMVAKRKLRERLRDSTESESDTSATLSVLSVMNISSGGGSNLDRLLEQQFQKVADRLHEPSPLAGHSAYHAAFVAGGTALSPLSSMSASLATKAAVAGVAATIVVGGAAAGTVATGSPSPTVWGQQVVKAVQGCKTAEAASDATTSGGAPKNVGQCVSTFAKQHGVAQRALHAESNVAHQDQSTGTSGDHPEGEPTPGVGPGAVTNGKPSTVGAGQSGNHGGGRPSGVPGGRPSSKPTK
jgi:RNA polymerase sigma-70 factor, ECF subfamily